MDWLDGGEDLLTAQRERDKPRQGVVANTLKLHRNGAVGFIDWLDLNGWLEQKSSRCSRIFEAREYLRAAKSESRRILKCVVAQSSEILLSGRRRMIKKLRERPRGQQPKRL